MEIPSRGKLRSHAEVAIWTSTRQVRHQNASLLSWEVLLVPTSERAWRSTLHRGPEPCINRFFAMTIAVTGPGLQSESTQNCEHCPFLTLIDNLSSTKYVFYADIGFLLSPDKLGSQHKRPSWRIKPPSPSDLSLVPPQRGTPQEPAPPEQVQVNTSRQHAYTDIAGAEPAVEHHKRLENTSHAVAQPVLVDRPNLAAKGKLKKQPLKRAYAYDVEKDACENRLAGNVIDLVTGEDAIESVRSPKKSKLTCMERSCHDAREPSQPSSPHLPITTSDNQLYDEVSIVQPTHV